MEIILINLNFSIKFFTRIAYVIVVNKIAYSGGSSSENKKHSVVLMIQRIVVRAKLLYLLIFLALLDWAGAEKWVTFFYEKEFQDRNAVAISLGDLYE